MIQLKLETYNNICERLAHLESENKQLKVDLEHARSYKHTIKMRNRNLQTENERLKAENLKHREDKMTMSLKYNEVLNELNDENERLKRELKQTEAQDQVVIDGLRKDNERLKKKLEQTEANNELQGKSLEVHSELITKFRKENAKLKCLALHLFKRLAYHEANEWSEVYDLSFPCVATQLYKSHSERWWRIANKFNEAYRKAKKALREGK